MNPPYTGDDNLQPKNLAARAGRWSATHRKTAIIGWILFVVLATVIGGKVGKQNLESSKMGNGESKRHDIIVDNANYPEDVGERVLIQGKGSIKADSPEVTTARQGRRQSPRPDQGRLGHREPAQGRASREYRLEGRPLGARELHDAGQGRHEGGASRRWRARPTPRWPPSPRSRRPIPSCSWRSTASASERKALGATERADEAKAKQISIVGTLIILLIVFGAAVAAGVPLLLGVSAFVATTGLLAPASQLAPLHAAVQQSSRC